MEQEAADPTAGVAPTVERTRSEFGSEAVMKDVLAALSRAGLDLEKIGR